MGHVARAASRAPEGGSRASCVFRWERRRPRASLEAATAGPGERLASAQGASRLRVSEPSVSRSLVLSARQGPAGTLRERGTVVRPRLGSRAGPSGVAYKASCALAAPRCPRPQGPRLLSARRGAGARRRGRAPAWEAQSAEARLALRVGGVSRGLYLGGFWHVSGLLRIDGDACVDTGELGRFAGDCLV